MVSGRKMLALSFMVMMVLGLLLQGCNTKPAETSASTSTEGNNTTLDYPKKPLTLVVWGAPGSGTDVMGRALASVAEPFYGQPIVVVNKTGGSGVTALNYTNLQPADGYTANVVTATLLSLVAQGKAEMPQLIIKTNDSIEYIVVRKESPFQTLEDMINYAKEHQGQLTVAGSLAGSYGHQFMLDVAKKAGIEINYVPYDGTSETITAALNGEVDAAIGGGNFGPQIASGNVRALAANIPAASFPDVPVLDDLGIPETPQNWRAISVAKGTPNEIVDYLHEAFKQAFETEEWQTYLEQSNEDYVYITRENLQLFAESQIEPTREYLESVGLLE